MLNGSAASYSNSTSALHAKSEDCPMTFPKTQSEKLSKIQELADTHYNLAVRYQMGDGVTQNIPEAERLYKLAANGFYFLGVQYEDERSEIQDLAKALECHTRAAKLGHIYAPCNLGIFYQYGRGIEQDYVQAATFFRISADHNVAFAQYNLGLCYEMGSGVEKSPEKAVHYYRKAAEQGVTHAQFNLGVCYDQGIGVEKNEKEAAEYYRKAAEKGFVFAQVNLGICYKLGSGIEKNLEKAKRLFRLAAEQGDANAQICLRECEMNLDESHQDLMVGAEHLFHLTTTHSHSDEKQNSVELQKRVKRKRMR